MESSCSGCGVQLAIQILCKPFSGARQHGFVLIDAADRAADDEAGESAPGREGGPDLRALAVASLRGRYVLNPDVGDGDLLIALSSGLGVIHRYGRVWEDVKGTTDAALAGGLTTRLHRVNSRLCYGLDFDGFLSRSGYTDYGDFRTSSRLHFDLVSSFALSFSL